MAEPTDNEKLYSEGLKFLVDSLKETKDFVLTEAPEVIQQLIVWKRAETTLVVLCSLVAAIAVLCMGLRVRDRVAVEEESEIDKLVVKTFGTIITVAVSFIVALPCFVNAPCCLQVWLAPKVYVLEYFGTLIR